MAKLSIYLASLMLSTNFSASTPPAHPSAVVARASVGHAAPRVQVDPTETYEEQRFVDMTNGERRARGLVELEVNPMLVEVARAHSQEMWEKSYFNHVSPTPGLKTPMARYLKFLGHTPTWAFLGENLFYCSVVDVTRGHRALMASEKHRDNIVNEQFREIGVGAYVAPNGEFYVTQLFLAQTD